MKKVIKAMQVKSGRSCRSSHEDRVGQTKKIMPGMKGPEDQKGHKQKVK